MLTPFEDLNKLFVTCKCFNLLIQVLLIVCIINKIVLYFQTLAESVAYIGASVSAMGNVEINTSWAAWVMVLLYSRFAVLFILNLILIVSVVLHVRDNRTEISIVSVVFFKI